MLKSRHLFLSIIATIILFAASSCVTGYIPIESTNKWTGRADTIKLQNCTAKVYMYSTIKKDTAAASILIIINNIAKNSHLTISNIKTGLADYPATAGEYVLKDVRLNTQAYTDTISYEKPVTDSMLRNGKGIDLANWIEYVFVYNFINTHARRYPRKMQVTLDAKIDNNGKTETLTKNILFKRYSGVNLAGN